MSSLKCSKFYVGSVTGPLCAHSTLSTEMSGKQLVFRAQEEKQNEIASQRISAPNFPTYKYNFWP